VKTCANCKMGERGQYNESQFVICRALPPRPIVIENVVHWAVPTMKPVGTCGLFKLSLWKLIRGNGA